MKILSNETLIQLFKEKLATRYARSSVLAYSKDLTHIADYLKEVSLLSLSTEDIEAYLAHNATLVKDNGTRLFKDSSLKRQRASLVSFYNFLMEEHLVDENPASPIKFELQEEDHQLTYLTKEEAITFLNHIKYFNSNDCEFLKTRDYFLVRLTLNTGLRIQEAKRLEPSWFNFETHELTIIDKDGNARVVPFTADLKADYDAYMIEREKITIKEDYQNRVFVTRRGGALTTQIANSTLYRHAEHCRINKGVSNSVLRHTFAYNLIQATSLPTEKKAREKAVKQLAYLLGHESHYFTLKVYDPFFALKEQQSLTDLIAI